MKVLQVISSISAARGGPSTALRNLVKALRSQGVHTDIASTDDDGSRKTQAVTHQEFMPVDGGRVVYFPRQTEFYAASLPMLYWLLKHARDYDLLHIHGLFNFAATAGALSATIAGIPYVLTPHGTLNNWGRKYRRPRLKNASMRLIEARIINHARLIHFTSEVEQLEATSLGFCTPTLVVPLGLDIEALMKPASSVGTAIADNDLTAPQSVLFLSRIDRIKNLDVLLHAMHRVLRASPSTVLFIAGDGDPEIVLGLRSLGRQLGIESNLRWLGFVSGPRKKWLLENCTLLAMPSQSENFGLSAVEAMAHSMPVILTPGVGLAPMVERYGAGSVCKVDPEQLAATIIAFLTDSERRRHAGLAGKRLVHNELSLEVFGQRLSQMYEQALASGRNTREETPCVMPPRAAD